MSVIISLETMVISLNHIKDILLKLRLSFQQRVCFVSMIIGGVGFNKVDSRYKLRISDSHPPIKSMLATIP